MYKVLDLREGMYLQRSDIYDIRSDALYDSLEEAENAIINLCYISKLGLDTVGRVIFNRDELIIPQYFEIVKQVGSPVNT